ncbi:hypothetical protein NADFUDRAFT_46867 [Nadsonia fulvescens var. elongata DSM 6958]|uniref:RING-type domain-containing protein n=1 Tax=Nadsonia fulvescens var. elongata DSM 6958 TaxID=857566 RepID=A0A1E3PII9_9ASCO|nr:hypothetical protein NADFUDRAFT_46867 [Nadsonia fulvescens var. elongata DSM 6958]
MDLANSTTSGFPLTRLLSSFRSAIILQKSQSDVSFSMVNTSVMNYLISPYAFVCALMAIILNRTTIFAVARRPRPLSVTSRVILRASAIFFMIMSTLPFLNRMGWITAYDDIDTALMFRGLYYSICYSHFIDLFTSVVQGHIPSSETGMTLFEYSIAFQEAQMASKLTPEILMICLISSSSQILLHMMGIFNWLGYRLIPSTYFGLSFLSYFGYKIYKGRVFGFPLVCIFGFLPQLTTLFVIIICLFIHRLARLFAGRDSLRTSIAANVTLNDDFYSTLTKVGVLAMTSGAIATYMSEMPSIALPKYTYLELKPLGLGTKVIPRGRGYRTEIQSCPDIDKAAEVDAQLTLVFSTLFRIKTTAMLIFDLIRVIWRVIKNLVWHAPPSHKDSDNAKEALTVMKLLGINAYQRFEDGSIRYDELLMGRDLPEIDDDEEWKPHSQTSDDDDDEYSSDDERYELESDLDEGITTPVTMVNNPSNYSSTSGYMASSMSCDSSPSIEKPVPIQRQKSHTAMELVPLLASSVDGVLSLLDSSHNQTLLNHVNYRGKVPLTRSSYNSMLKNSSSRYGIGIKDGLETENDRILLDVIRQRRFNDDTTTISGSQKDRNSSTAMLCVVCQANDRQVILWPCRCLALCEQCRLILASQSFNGCVCCRREVEGFSQIFIP